MDRTQALNTPTVLDVLPLGLAACPRCGEESAAPPAVTTALFPGLPLRRCARCGTRFTSGDSAPRLAFSCDTCGLPFLTGELLPTSRQRCPDCRGGRLPAELPGRELAAATEAEVQLALNERWSFVTSPILRDYLDRLTEQVASRIEGAPPGAHVVLIDDWALRTLALPSGAILMSLGTLAGLEDEAELVFVLGHELAHAASGDAAVRLVRLGFQAVSSGGKGAPAQAAWGEAALDLIKLGYGRAREKDADARAVEALRALDYDPRSALRYLERLQARVERGAGEVSELAVAHPPPLVRIRHIERQLYGRLEGGATGRVNRELFRRVAGHRVLTSEMIRVPEPERPRA
ncbi:MAG TPA: M48 family metallopeptidase, partial [Candidatus Polarisedimenticolaceae bacterium]|nr:M48 family metallopeptidase [Candidatus Polarisedimenticolaceae bacterium]